MLKRPINLRLDADLVAAADALASAMGTDRTELISRGLRRELLHDGEREFVYVLLDGSEVRYVGRSRDPYQRLRQHIAEARAGGTSPKGEWLSEMLKAGRTPRLAIIDDGSAGDEIQQLEGEWIEHFRKGERLTNRICADVVKVPRPGGSHQRSLRIPEDLHRALNAEAARRGRPHTYSSVLIEWAEHGQLVTADGRRPSSPRTPSSRRPSILQAQNTVDKASSGMPEPPPVVRPSTKVR
jgi:GIY-YIG catalytic domain